MARRGGPVLRVLSRLLIDLDRDRPEFAARLLAAALAHRPRAGPLLSAAASLEKRRTDRRPGGRAHAGRPRDPAEQAIDAARADGLRHDWHGAVRTLDAYLASGSEPGSAGQMQALAKLYAEHQDDEEGSATRRLTGVEVRYLNLDRDGLRRSRFEAAFSTCGIEAVRHPAVLGEALPHWALRDLAGRAPATKPSTLGVFLSHVAAWEQVARADRPSLILEDDAVPLFRFGSVLESLAARTQELTFVNNRISNKLWPEIRKPDGFSLEPLIDRAALFAGARAAGADGYILAPAGARRLLSYVGEDGCLGHVDAQLLSYALPRDAGRPQSSDLGAYWSRLDPYWSRHVGARDLHATVAYPPLVQHVDQGRSARRDGSL